MSSSLKSVLARVLSVGNKEMNQHYPPHVYEEHFNIATNFILDECVRLYPQNQSIVDVIRPFMRVELIPVKNGVAEMPEDYRNFFGASVNTTTSANGRTCECAERVIKDCVGGASRTTETHEGFPDDPLVTTPEEFKKSLLSFGCSANDVTILDPDEFNYRTRHPYKKKRISLSEPVAKMIGRQLHLCPGDLSGIAVFYTAKPKEYRFGYETLPDETTVFEPSLSEESEWDDTAFQYLFKAVSSLYGIYTRDPEMMGWSAELKKIGLF